MSFQIEGLNETLAGLDSVAGKGLLVAIQRAAKSEADKAAATLRSITPKGKTGNLRKGVKSGKLPIKPGDRIPAGAWFGNFAPHGHLAELGTKERFHKTGKSVGKMPAMRLVEKARKRIASSAPAKIEAAVGRYTKSI